MKKETKKATCVQFPVMRLAKAPAHRIPSRSFFEEDHEARLWLKNCLSVARIEVDDELFWLCYEHPEPLPAGSSAPDLMEHLALAVKRMWAFREETVFKVFDEAMTMAKGEAWRFPAGLPKKNTCYGGLPKSLWPLYFPKYRKDDSAEGRSAL